MKRESGPDPCFLQKLPAFHFILQKISGEKLPPPPLLETRKQGTGRSSFPKGQCEHDFHLGCITKLSNVKINWSFVNVMQNLNLSQLLVPYHMKTDLFSFDCDNQTKSLVLPLLFLLFQLQSQDAVHVTKLYSIIHVHLTKPKTNANNKRKTSNGMLHEQGQQAYTLAASICSWTLEAGIATSNMNLKSSGYYKFYQGFGSARIPEKMNDFLIPESNLITFFRCRSNSGAQNKIMVSHKPWLYPFLEDDYAPCL